MYHDDRENLQYHVYSFSQGGNGSYKKFDLSSKIIVLMS